MEGFRQMKCEIEAAEGLSLLSHEIKNSLAGLKMGLKELYSLKKDEKSEMIEALLEELNHLHQITMDTLTITGPMKLKVESVDLEKLSKESAKVVLGSLDENNPSTIFDFSADFPSVLCDRGLMKSVFINLVNNAFEEVGNEGIIHMGGRYLNNEIVEMWVEDNGRGIEGNPWKIFQRFKSTKGGIGVGLSLVRKIVYEHFGTIRVESALNRGTKFIIEMPSDFHSIDRRSRNDRRKSIDRRKEEK